MEGRGNAGLFVGWFLKNQGDAQNAKKYLQSLLPITRTRSSGTAISLMGLSSDLTANDSSRYQGT